MMITLAVLFVTITAMVSAQDAVAEKGKAKLQLQSLGEYSLLARELAAKYQQEHSGVTVQVSILTAEDIELQGISNQMMLVNKSTLNSLAAEPALKMVVGRDVLVPVMSKDQRNESVFQRGISPEQFASIFGAPGGLSWGQLLGSDDKRPVTVFIPDGKVALSGLADFLDMSPGSLEVFESFTGEEMMRKLKANSGALGFCTLACLVDMEQKGITPPVSVVPVDRDGDGRIGQFEDIYRSYAELSHGIFVGKYPRELNSKIYVIGNQHSFTEAEASFLEWILTGGQSLFAQAGILSIDYGERAAGLRQLIPVGKPVADIPLRSTAGMLLPLLIVGLAVLTLLLWLITGYYVDRKGAGGKLHSEASLPVAKLVSSFPAGLFFDRTHTWTFMEKSGNVRIGIDEFIQHVTGSVTRVLIKSPGDSIKKGEPLFTLVQQGKKLVINSPLSGKVLERNDELLENASLLNTDPYTDGWLYMVEPANWRSEVKSYFMGEPYGAWLKDEYARLKDFFAGLPGVKSSLKLLPVMQDGGEIREGVLEDLGPAEWEEFQSRFINCK